MDYRDLELNVLSVESTGKKSKLKSLLADLFVKKKDTEQPEGKPTGEIRFERRKDRFLFNYWWNTVKSGVISSISKVPVDAGKSKVN
jgi:hypothetical protein